MSHEIETMAYNSQEGKPWHNLGVDVEGFMTMLEALEKGGLNWHVDKKPVYDSYGEEIPGYFANTRDSDNSVLGIVQERYKIVQNVDALNFLDTLVGEGQAIYDTVASLKSGRKIFATVKVPTETEGADPIEKYLIVTNSHDGSSPVQVIASDIRVVCNNTLTMALRGAKNKFSVRHTTNLESKLHEAHRILAESLKYFHKTTEVLNNMKEIPFNERQLQELIGRIYNFDNKVPEHLTLEQFMAGNDDITTRQKNITDQIIELSHTGKGVDLPGVKGTAYGAFNAVTEYLDHYSTNRVHKNRDTADVKIDAIHFGSVAQKRQNTFDNILEMTALTV